MRAGSLSVLRSSRPRWPKRQMLSAAWSTVSSKVLPLHSAGRANVARELRSLITRAITVASDQSSVKKQ
eukprot:9202794-Alexandrium_andersonii.AAC.1